MFDPILPEADILSKYTFLMVPFVYLAFLYLVKKSFTRREQR